MKIAKKDIALVMVIVALLAAFAAYKFSLSSNLDAVEEEESKQAALQQQIDEVKARADQVEKMEKEIAEWQKNVAAWIKPFHAMHKYEDGIMYLRNLEHQDEKDTDPFKVRILEWLVNETGVDSTITGQGSFKNSEFYAGSAKYTYQYWIEANEDSDLTGYQQLKNFLTYVISEVDGFGVKSLDSMSFELEDGVDRYKGEIGMTAYSIAEIDGGKAINPYVPQNLEDIEQGLETDSIFGDFKDEEDKEDK